AVVLTNGYFSAGYNMAVNPTAPSEPTTFFETAPKPPAIKKPELAKKMPPNETAKSLDVSRPAAGAANTDKKELAAGVPTRASRPIENPRAGKRIVLPNAGDTASATPLAADQSTFVTDLAGGLGSSTVGRSSFADRLNSVVTKSAAAGGANWTSDDLARLNTD